MNRDPLSVTIPLGAPYMHPITVIKASIKSLAFQSFLVGIYLDIFVNLSTITSIASYTFPPVLLGRRSIIKFMEISSHGLCGIGSELNYLYRR